MPGEDVRWRSRYRAAISPPPARTTSPRMMDTNARARFVAQRRRGRIEISGTTGSRTTDDTIVCAAFRRLCKSTAPIPMFGRI